MPEVLALRVSISPSSSLSRTSRLALRSEAPERRQAAHRASGSQSRKGGPIRQLPSSPAVVGSGTDISFPKRSQRRRIEKATMFW